MSRIGKLPVTVPAGVEVTIDGQLVEVKGAKGALKRQFHPLVEIVRDEGDLRVKPREESKNAIALWGLSRSLLFNMVHGVSAGFTKVLEINGVGYRAELNGGTLKLALGFSHPVEFVLPEGVSGAVEKNTIVTLSSIDKELLGQTAATIRRYRPPEPYKGKGIKYSDEVIRRKVGKAGTK
ncbi:ribosomal protein L6 [Desulfarculus baarsii DSM 2075]|uniref:Large ribosomal subunit protein uL6 n=1 Tax=Desulfarculus baarsii (strain ATCC 33931 / DSM 2075 / LMG 7858 / VKM B-1802 / 2st14) TaxID=644282 RepID=E1QKR7_DESB2|nr:50S ribosomal protein L6 [Desulfarculus baarsii]ADK86276.1 ribosomal protein L6 [Desulfarculus baarsii DSM 2075]